MNIWLSIQENADGGFVAVPVRILNLLTATGRPNLEASGGAFVRRFLLCDAVSGRESGPGGPGEAYLEHTGYLRVVRWAAHLAVQAKKIYIIEIDLDGGLDEESGASDGLFKVFCMPFSYDKGVFKSLQGMIF